VSILTYPNNFRFSANNNFRAFDPVNKAALPEITEITEKSPLVFYERRRNKSSSLLPPPAATETPVGQTALRSSPNSPERRSIGSPYSLPAPT
jgi:hypothetical protein